MSKEAGSGGFSPTNSNHSDFGTQTEKSASVDYKTKYEKERGEKEKLAAELSDVTEMLNEIRMKSRITDKL